MKLVLSELNVAPNNKRLKDGLKVSDLKSLVEKIHNQCRCIIYLK